MSRTLAWGISWGPAVAWATVLFLLSATPDPPGSGLFARIPGGDKLVHLGLYAVLGGLLAWGRRRHLRGASAGPWLHAALILAGALYGVSDEWHQSFVPGRDASALAGGPVRGDVGVPGRFSRRPRYGAESKLRMIV